MVFIPPPRAGIPELGEFYAPAGGLFQRWSDVVYWMKGSLQAAGWVVRRSGNGAGTFALGDVITELVIRNNTNCWFEIAQIASARPRVLVFWRGATLDAWRIAYTDNTSFAPSIEGDHNSPATYPAGSEENVIMGGGTVAAPTFGSWSLTLFGDGVTTGYRFSSAISIAEPYWFWFSGWYKTGATTFTESGGAIFMDAIEPSSVRSDALGVPQDFDPVVVGAAHVTEGLDAYHLSLATLRHFCWTNRTGLGTGVFTSIKAMRYNDLGVNEPIPQGITGEPKGGLDDTVDALWARGPDLFPQDAVKGFSQIFRYLGRIIPLHPSLDLPGDARNTRTQRYLANDGLILQGRLRTSSAIPGDPPVGKEVDPTIFPGRFIKDPFNHDPLAVVSFPAETTYLQPQPTLYKVNFSKGLDPDSVTASTVILSGDLSGVVSITRSVTGFDLRVLHVIPTIPLVADAYTLTIVGGGAGVKAYDGNQMGSSVLAAFTVATPVDPGGGGVGRALLNGGLEG
jgi:hypothetical protein